MLRSLPALLLLANYLLVVCAGLLAGSPEVPAFSAAHPYVHSQQCQQTNYLHLDCFEQCNGPQHTAKTRLPKGSLQLLHQLKRLDVHCESSRLNWRLIPAPAARAAADVARAAVGTVPSGFGLTDYPPPKKA